MTQPYVGPFLNAADMAPIEALLPITPGTALANGVTRGFLVNAAGNIAIVDTQGNAATLAVNAGTVYWIRITAVATSGTTATGIFGLY